MYRGLVQNDFGRVFGDWDRVRRGYGGEIGGVTRDFELAPSFDRSPFDRPATPRSQQGIVLLVKHQGF